MGKRNVILLSCLLLLLISAAISIPFLTPKPEVAVEGVHTALVPSPTATPSATPTPVIQFVRKSRNVVTKTQPTPTPTIPAPENKTSSSQLTQQSPDSNTVSTIAQSGDAATPTPIPTSTPTPTPSPQQTEGTAIVQCTSALITDCNKHSGELIISGNGGSSSNGAGTGNTVTVVNHVNPTPTPFSGGSYAEVHFCRTDDPECSL